MPIDDIRDHLGEVRRLGYIAPDSSKEMLRASRANIQSLRSLIPVAQWQPVDYVTGFPSSLINNQGQLGACTAFSACGASARQRYMRTGQIVPLSGFWVYDQINGGSDNGSNIIDSMGVLESHGAPLASAYTKCQFRVGLPAGNDWYKEDVAITVGSSDECATALQLGMLVQAPILVTKSFESFTGDGVAWGGSAPRSSSSNHSIYLAGMKQVGGQWYFILVNSWGANWGPFGNGSCLIPLAAIDNPAQADDGYAHASTLPKSDSTGVPA